MGENNGFRYFQKFKNRASAYAEINDRAAIAALISTQLFSRQFYISGAETDAVVRVGTDVVAVEVEHASIGAIVPIAATGERPLGLIVVEIEIVSLVF